NSSGVLRLGRADAAAPVAQTLQAQSVVTGTSNTAGTDFSIAGSQSTGSAAGGSIIIKVSPAGGGGTSVNALATAATFNSAKALTVVGAFGCNGATAQAASTGYGTPTN